MNLAPLIVFLLAACARQSSAPAENEAVAVVQTSTASPAPSPPKAFTFDEENDLIEFHFGWSAEAAAIPRLVTRFRAEMEKARAELVDGAKEDKAFRDKEGFDFHGYMSSTEYETAGQSERLLSLRVEFGSFTGGAHGNHGTRALLWDRASVSEIKVSQLFAEASNLERLLTQHWCDALNKARVEKRGEPVGGEGMFDECPEISEIAVIPTDKDKDARFDMLTLVASPYVAGPYVEGSYEIELAVTPDLLVSLKSYYRPNFEIGQMQ